MHVNKYKFSNIKNELIRGCVTLLPFVFTLTEERQAKPYNCLFAYLITLSDKAKYPYLYYPDFILTETQPVHGYQY